MTARWHSQHHRSCARFLASVALLSVVVDFLHAGERTAAAAKAGAPAVRFIVNHMYAAEHRQISYHLHYYSLFVHGGSRYLVVADGDVLIRPFRTRESTHSFIGLKIITLDLQVGDREAERSLHGRWTCRSGKPTIPITGLFTKYWRPWLIRHAVLIGTRTINGEAVWHLRAPTNIAGWYSAAGNVVTSWMDFFVAQSGFTLRRIRSVASLRGPGIRGHHFDGVDWTRYGERVDVTLPSVCSGT
jgi:hypothetical protein